MIRKSKKPGERPHLLEARIGELTQGTIFSCVNIPRYQASVAVGIVITARCDIAQDKYPILNFVPAVPLSEWFRRDGLQLLVEAERKSIYGKLVGILKEQKLSEALITSVSLGEIAKAHFPENGTGRAEKKRADRFKNVALEMSNFENLLERDDTDIFDWFASNKSKDVKAMVARLSKHEVSGYYFLEHLQKNVDQKPFVCLLRDVTAISRDLSEKIAGGLSSHVLKSHPNLVERGHFSISSDDLCMPISCLGSPTIEHLLQTFSSLFGRIGLEDPDEDLLGRISEKLSQQKEI